MTDDPNSELDAAVRRAFLEEASELLRRIDVAENALSEAEAYGRPEQLQAIARALHTLKGASSACGELGVRDECHRMEELVVAMVEAFSEGTDFDPQRLRQAIAGLHRLVSGVVNPPEPMPRPAPEPAPRKDVPSASREPVGGSPSIGSELLRVRPERVDSLHALASELVVLRLQNEAQVRRLVEARDSLAELVVMGERAVAGERRRKSSGLDGTARLLRQLESLTREIVARHREIAGVTTALSSTVTGTGSVADALLSGVGDLRMMPLAPFFESFVGAARDAAFAMGTDVRVAVRAEGAELDRAVLTRLREPMIHLVRNAVAHGIESPEARARIGKPRGGHILLEGRSEGSRAILRVVDDGGGIDLARVRERAVREGLLDADSSEPLDGERLFDILSRPGFSTRAEVDRLAGRGVGLDVVADVVRSLSGKVSIDTVPGIGTAIQIEVPISASTSAGLLVRCADHVFAVLLNHVERVVRVRLSELRSSAGVTTLRIDNEAVAVVSLASLLGVATPSVPDDVVSGVVIHVGRRRLVCVVDELLGEQSLIVRPMPDAFVRATSFAGAAVQEDGSVLPVLDSTRLVEVAVHGASGGRYAAQVAREEERTESLKVLVVDDSVTMRTLLRNILRSAGYDVSVAQGGEVALETLGSLERCDLVVTDLEMPGMDGTELCRAVRASKFANVPIIMVTSVASDDSKSRAMVAGADAYIVKSSFAQGPFLELTRTLVRRENALGRVAC